MPFTIRPAIVDDVAELARAHVETWRETYSHLLPPEFFSDELLERRVRMWQHITTDPRPGDDVRVAEIDGTIVGFAMTGESYEKGGILPVRKRSLFSIYTYARVHGQGVGQALLDAVCGDEPYELWVAADNPRATRFYERNGFALDGTVLEDTTAHGITEVRMVR